MRVGAGSASSSRPARLRPAVQRTRRWLAGEADADAAPRWLAWTVLTAPFVGGLVLFVAFIFARPQYYLVLQEDRLVEWLQFSLCLLGALLAAAVVRMLVRRGEYAFAATVLMVALGLVLLSGEEISWGQRVFALVTPAELATVNAQRELNVHNVEAGGLRLQDAFKLVSFGLGVAGVALSLLARGPQPRLRGPVWQLLAPPLYTIPAFAGMALYRPLVLVAPLDPLVRFQEWVEASLFIGLAASIFCIYLRSRQPAARPWRLPVIALVGTSGLTVLFAVLTAYHGIVPGNVVQ